MKYLFLKITCAIFGHRPIRGKNLRMWSKYHNTYVWAGCAKYCERCGLRYYDWPEKTDTIEPKIKPKSKKEQETDLSAQIDKFEKEQPQGKMESIEHFKGIPTKKSIY